jgi:hypothetical protein
MTAAAVGLNLQCASGAIYATLGHTPTQMTQANARLWRMGQDKQVVVSIPMLMYGYEYCAYQNLEKRLNKAKRLYAAMFDGAVLESSSQEVDAGEISEKEALITNLQLLQDYLGLDENQARKIVEKQNAALAKKALTDNAHGDKFDEDD